MPVLAPGRRNTILAFVKGDQMSAPNYVDMPKAVKPGETIDLSADMIAPTAPGKYTVYFMLVNQNGVRFGTGSDAKRRLLGKYRSYPS